MKKRSLTSVFFILFLSVLLVSTFKTEVFAQTTPKVAIVSLDHVPFVAGDKNEFYISSKDYTGKVQYQLFYIQESVMKEWKLINNADMNNGWTNSIDAQDATTVSISSLNLKADKYRFAIRVRRVGVKGLKQNSYGDYDDAYPFNLDVVKNTNIKLSDNMNIEKTNFTRNESLIINGVGSLSKNVQYKLHLFDVKNSKWLTNLTDYNTSVNYSLKEIPEGTYIVDLWAKNIYSNNKYDGWKLKTITVQNGLDEDKIIKFPDSKLDKVIRSLIGKPYGNIYKSDVEKIEKLEWYFESDTEESIPEEEMIFDIRGIENLTNLKELNLQWNSISDISSLAGLTKLTAVSLSYNEISDISALRGLNNLTYLDLSLNEISDISGVKGLMNLEYLDMYCNNISDISALKGLTNLTTLDLYDNNISDISALKGLTNLTYLGLSENQISSISALSTLTNLTGLDLYYNNINDLSALKGLVNLTGLDLGQNNISDISTLAGLTDLETLNLSDNQISNIRSLRGLTNLMWINLSNNKISDADMQWLKDTLPEGAEIQ